MLIDFKSQLIISCLIRYLNEKIEIFSEDLIHTDMWGVERKEIPMAEAVVERVDGKIPSPEAKRLPLGQKLAFGMGGASNALIGNASDS